MNYVYRVDPFCTDNVVRVQKSRLHEETPINVWLDAMIGEGYYCYTETLDQAKEKFTYYMEELISDAKARIKRINNLTEEECIDD
jgi:hypothetical protein